MCIFQHGPTTCFVEKHSKKEAISTQTIGQLLQTLEDFD